MNMSPFRLTPYLITPLFFKSLFLQHSHAAPIYPSPNSKFARTFSKLIDKKLVLHYPLNRTDGEHFISFIMSIVISDV